MTTSIQFQREIPVRHVVDVFVAGGGPAGVAAAVTAARHGASVFLAEGHACFGGMGTAGLVPSFMQFANGVQFLAGGIGREVFTRLCALGGPNVYDDPEQHGILYTHGYLGIYAEALKRIYDDLMMESGAQFTLQTQFIGVEKERDDQVSVAICQAKSGLFAVQAREFIDCTGDGDLAVMAGAPFSQGDETGQTMSGTLCSLWTGIDWDTVTEHWIAPKSRLAQAFADGIFTVQDPHLLGLARTREALAGGNIGHLYHLDGTDERSITRALIAGRASLPEYQRFYREYLRGYEQMELVASAAMLGVRESRRISGEYTLTYNDYLARASFPDEIGRYAYPIDIHPSTLMDDTPAEQHPPLLYADGESYGIPFRTLLPRGTENVLVAGRCISADRPMQSSTRVMPCCFITGQAAGLATALASRLEVPLRQLPIEQLQECLRQKDVYLTPASASGVDDGQE